MEIDSNLQTIIDALLVGLMENKQAQCADEKSRSLDVLKNSPGDASSANQINTALTDEIARAIASRMLPRLVGSLPQTDLFRIPPPGGLTEHFGIKAHEAFSSSLSPDETYQEARFVVLEEFLAPEELATLTQYAIGHEADFDSSKVIAPDANDGVIDYRHRRSRVLFHTGKHEEVIKDRIFSFLRWVLDKLQHPLFSVSRVEVQLTASNDGEYFKLHNDNTHEALVTREITFVYFFHREPKAFIGGELRIYDSRWENGRYVAAGKCKTIIPQQNQVVFFPSFFMHEVAQVSCPTHSFRDSRFTLNGWIHRGRT